MNNSSKKWLVLLVIAVGSVLVLMSNIAIDDNLQKRMWSSSGHIDHYSQSQYRSRKLLYHHVVTGSPSARAGQWAQAQAQALP
ncbi:hypothetical protein HS088_TW03G00656 [Tripterygium wilfordii]|uniref:Uncharacterized protein n=1 Tax=Tripterygium wilfordii TaxID=458696 RepID=A0A7J7DVC7_TRIWF|nr:hypothetical protein HS088_TW03G00656 [Tripterygium wilfordii]